MQSAFISVCVVNIKEAMCDIKAVYVPCYLDT